MEGVIVEEDMMVEVGGGEEDIVVEVGSGECLESREMFLERFL